MKKFLIFAAMAVPVVVLLVPSMFQHHGILNALYAAFEVVGISAIMAITYEAYEKRAEKDLFDASVKAFLVMTLGAIAIIVVGWILSLLFLRTPEWLVIVPEVCYLCCGCAAFMLYVFFMTFRIDSWWVRILKILVAVMFGALGTFLVMRYIVPVCGGQVPDVWQRILLWVTGGSILGFVLVHSIWRARIQK